VVALSTVGKFAGQLYSLSDIAVLCHDVCYELNFKLLLEILEVSWNLVDAAGKFYN